MFDCSQNDIWPCCQTKYCGRFCWIPLWTWHWNRTRMTVSETLSRITHWSVESGRLSCTIGYSERKQKLGCMLWVRNYSSSSNYIHVMRNPTGLVSVFTARCYAERGIAIVCCPSVRLSVTLRYVFHTAWNTSKITSRPNSLRPWLWGHPTWAIWCNRNTPKIGVE